MVGMGATYFRNIKVNRTDELLDVKWEERGGARDDSSMLMEGEF